MRRTIRLASSVLVVAVLAYALYRFGLPAIQIYAAAIGALVAFIGVHIKASYDAEDKDRERGFNLRRDVFLEVAEGIARAQNYLANMGHPGLAQEKIGEVLLEYPAWLQKLELVGNIETIRAARSAVLYHSRTTIDLTKRRFDLQKAVFDLELIEQHRKTLNELQITLMNDLREAAAPTTQDRDQRLRLVNESLPASFSEHCRGGDKP